MDSEASTDVIELRVDAIDQLFHTLDPFPFREKDLDKEAEEYIVGWARELPKDQPIRIVVHLPEAETKTERARDLGNAFSRFFDYRASALSRDINELFRIGRRSLAVGVTILICCFVSANIAAEYLGGSPVARLVEESFLILGWVANWRPLEIFLYDWWPLAHRRDLYRRLAAATVASAPYIVETRNA
jgi:hypothetical protein